MTRLKCEGDVQVWLESEACSRLLAFLKKLFVAIKGKTQSAIDRIQVKSERESDCLVAMR